ncbi:hypothetical protein CTI12_AA044530 [Artemisia annua]|uniref:Uncharacterized protein n=1 Tax=Artemisia annua TaxID=35608 RepID=A0A2U1QD94_ARTAN|nr:hypothetical protein CTI12_AA044530 [Artemisia annua]
MAISEVAISIRAETQEQIDRIESDETTNKVIASEVPAHIVISIPDETREQIPAADPQSAPYFFLSGKKFNTCCLLIVSLYCLQEGNVEISQAILEEHAKTVEDWYRKAADRARYKKQAVPITCTTFDQDVLEGRAEVSQAHDHKHQPLMFGPASLVGGSITSERERIAAQVFQPSHRMPTMSIEEAGLKEMEMMNTWQEQITKMIEANSSWHTDKWKPRAGGGDHEEDEDDEATQDKAKAFDDWKDENPRGAGNSKLTPFGYFLHPIACH